MTLELDEADVVGGPELSIGARRVDRVGSVGSWCARVDEGLAVFVGRHDGDVEVGLRCPLRAGGRRQQGLEGGRILAVRLLVFLESELEALGILDRELAWLDFFRAVLTQHDALVEVVALAGEQDVSNSLGELVQLALLCGDLDEARGVAHAPLP